MSCLILVLLACWFISYARYRLPKAQPAVIFDAEVCYPMVQLAQTYRCHFETLLGNRLIRLQHSPALYLPLADYQQLWPKSPLTLSAQNCSLKAKLKARPLLFGGYAVAQLLSVETLNQAPLICK